MTEFTDFESDCLSETSSVDSLFDSADCFESLPIQIPGFSYYPNHLISSPVYQTLLTTLPSLSSSSTSSSRKTNNQIMFFGTLPKWCSDLIQSLETKEIILKEKKKEERKRQVVVNLYQPGEGLKDHIDLINRFDDEIAICSFGSGIPLRLTNTQCQKEEGQEQEQWEKYEMYLESGSVVVLRGEARYLWKHGIVARETDRIEMDDGNIWVKKRGTRMSVTIRWMLEGADMVGTENDHVDANKGEVDDNKPSHLQYVELDKCKT